MNNINIDNIPFEQATFKLNDTTDTIDDSDDDHDNDPDWIKTPLQRAKRSKVKMNIDFHQIIKFY